LSSDGRILTRLAQWVRSAARGRRGVASIEFGAIMACIVVIVLGTYDIGNYVLQQMKLEEAATVGGLYSVSYPLDTSGTLAAVNDALPTAWVGGVAITGPSMTCTCGTSGTGDAATCTASCPTGQVARFVTVSLQRNYTPLLLTTILTSTTATYVAQIQ
jgi:Flp pilus assembly protein TadG